MKTEDIFITTINIDMDDDVKLALAGRIAAKGIPTSVNSAIYDLFEEKLGVKSPSRSRKSASEEITRLVNCMEDMLNEEI